MSAQDTIRCDVGRKSLLLACGALLAPLATLSLGVWITYNVALFLRYLVAWGCVFVSGLVGLPFLYYLPLRTWPKVWLTILYLPAIAIVLVLYGLYFACIVFGDCL